MSHEVNSFSFIQHPACVPRYWLTGLQKAYLDASFNTVIAAHQVCIFDPVKSYEMVCSGDADNSASSMKCSDKSHTSTQSCITHAMVLQCTWSQLRM